MSLGNSAPKCRQRYLRAGIRALLLLLVLLATAIDAAALPNVVLVVMDDVGIEHLNRFEVGNQGNFATTPKIDDFLDGYLHFRDAWSNPLCSPTRVSIMTGRFGFRTGIGGGIRCQTTGQLNTADQNLLPRLLKGAGYTTAAFGKWHMGEDPTSCDTWGRDRPILAGFDYFEGLLYNQQPPGLNYSNYRRTKVTPATPCAAITNEVVTTYMTDDIADAAQAWIGSATQPWFAYVAFTAAHKPFHCPPEGPNSPYWPLTLTARRMSSANTTR